MKKIISMLSALTILSASCTLTAFADDTVVPVDVDEAVYTQLLANKWSCDKNSDGIITEAELNEATQLSIDLTDIEDLSWLSMLQSCNYITLKNGTLTDLSGLTKLPKLSYLEMNNVPLTDISFIKDMELESCQLRNMDQITAAQKMEVLKWSAPDIWEGTAGTITCKPRNLTDYRVTLDNTDAAIFLSGSDYAVNSYEQVYGLKPGTVGYTVSLDGENYYHGEVTIKQSPGAYAPALHNTTITNYEVGQSNYYNPDSDGNSGWVILVNGTLYTIRGSAVQEVETDVKDYAYVYKRSYSGSYNYADMVLKTDGTLLLNGKSIMGSPVSAMRDGYILGENGIIYSIVPSGDGFTITTVASDSVGWVEDCSPLYISNTGNLKYYSTELIGDGRLRVYNGNTNIGKPISAYKNGRTCYVVDGSRTLFQLDFASTFTKTKLADNVISVGESEDGSRIEYTTTDGTTETILEFIRSSSYLAMAGKTLGIQAGSFYIHEYTARGVDENDAVFDYYINRDDTMSLTFLGNYCGLTNVEAPICTSYDTTENHGYVYFLRTDGSIWKYNLDTQQWQEAIAGTVPIPETIKGDINADGVFNVADVVLLQKWLLAVPDTKIADWKAGDFCEDDRLDVYDLCLMKRELLNHT